MDDSQTQHTEEETSSETVNLNESLIAFVKEHKILYDKGMRSYKNNKLRDKLWAKLASDLGKDVKSLTTRWRTLRDRYVKELKIVDLSHRSGAEAIDEDDPWELMDQMSFLKDHVSKRRTTSNYADAEAGTSQSTGFEQMVEEHLEEHSENTQDRSRTPSSARKRKADEIENKMSSLLDKYIANSDGKHTGFGQFVACKLSSLPTDLAERVEAKMLNVLYTAVEEYRAESGNKE